MKTNRNAISEDDVEKFAASGMAAFLPGMTYMVELMQRQLDEFRRELAMFQTMEAGAPPKKKLGRPPAKRASSGWPEDEAERKVEMARRQAVAAAKKSGAKTKLHPRDKRHPEHEAWRQMMSDAQKKHWTEMSSAQKKKQKQSIAKARAARANTARGAVEELRATA